MPSAFTGELTITQIDADWKKWRLEQDLQYEIGSLGSGRLVIAPAGMYTDGASVPRIVWALLPAWGRYSRAAVIHDFLCNLIAAGNDLEDEVKRMIAIAFPEGLTRKAADDVFLEAMEVCGVGLITRGAMYLAVRAYAVTLGL